MPKRIHAPLAAAAAMMFCAGGAHAANLEVNGSFETGDFTGWQQFPTGPGQQTIGGFDPTDGAFAANILNDVPASGSLIKNANIGIGQVAPGQRIDITFDARGAFGAGGVAFAEFFSEIDGGGTSSAEILGGGPLMLAADPAEWTSFAFTVFAGPDVSGGVTLQFAAVTGADPSSVANLFIDNVTVSTIPVPAAVWLFASGLGLLGLRRRRAA